MSTSEQETKEIRPDTIWSASYIALMAANFFSSMGQFMTSTTIPVYLDHMGESAGSVGVVVAAFFVAALLIRPIAGPAYDAFSKKKFMLIAQSGVCLSFFLYSMCTSVEALFAVRIFHGICGGTAIPLTLALVADTLPSTKFASGISIYTLAQSVAQAIGPAVGLTLAEAVGFSTTYFLSGVCLAIAMCGIALVKERPHKKLPYQFKLSRMFAREAVGKATAICLFMLSFSCVNAYLVLYGNLRGIENVGLYFTVYAVCLLATRTLYGKAADNLGAERVLLFGVVCFGITFVLISQMSDFASMMVVAVVSSLGAGACMPLAQTLALSSVPPERRGAASNTSFTGMDLGQFVGPIVGGHVIEALVPVSGSTVQAYSDMWLVMLIPIVIAFGMVISWNVKKSRAKGRNRE